MAKLEIQSSINRGRAEMRLWIAGIEASSSQGNSVFFTLHGNHILVEPQVINDKTRGPLPWYEALTEAEKLQVFNAILAEYRHRSLGEGDFKLAALGITEQGKIYISENTEQLSSDFNRQCAEQNMVTISTQRDVYEQIKQRIRDGEDSKTIVPTNPKYRAVYLMGGRLPEIPIACPCGNCTDLLAKVMMPDSQMWILPVNDGSKPLIPREGIDSANQLNDGEAWKTTITHLNRDRHITLEKPQADAMALAMKHALKNIRPWVARYAEDDINRAVAPTIIDPHSAAGKVLFKRHNGEDMIDLGKLHTFMQEHVMELLANRLESISKEMGLCSLKDLSDEQIEGVADVGLQWVRCAVVQRDDGKLYFTPDAKSVMDKAIPDAEISALGNAKGKLGNQGIRNCWAMEFNMADMKHGVIRTSSKAAVERLIKKESILTKQVDFGFMPFEDQPRSHDEIKASMITRTGQQLSPGYYTGKTKAGMLRVPENRGIDL